MNIDIECQKAICKKCNSKRPSDKSEWKKYLLKKEPEKDNKTTLKDAMKQRIIYLKNNQVFEDKYKTAYLQADKERVELNSRLKELERTIKDQNKFIQEQKNHIRNYRYALSHYKDAKDMEHLKRMPKMNPDLFSKPIDLDTLRDLFKRAEFGEDIEMVPTQEQQDKQSKDFIDKYQIKIRPNVIYSKYLLNCLYKEVSRKQRYRKILNNKLKESRKKLKEFESDNPTLLYKEEHNKLKKDKLEKEKLYNKIEYSMEEINNVVSEDIKWEIQIENEDYDRINSSKTTF